MRRKNILFFVGLINLLFIFTGCASNFEASYQFSDPTETPAPKADGRGNEIQNLVTLYGEDYEQDPYLREEVQAARGWLWQEAYESLDKKAAETPKYLDVFRLQAELYLVNSEYEAAVSQLDYILKEYPDDAHALSLAVLADYSLGNIENAEARLHDLEMINNEFSNDIYKVLEWVEDWSTKDFSKDLSPSFNPDVIAVFGEAPRIDYQLSQSVLNKVIKAKELLEIYPNAVILLSGGPVDQPISEAQTMKNWLVENGVSEEKIVMDELARDTVGNAIGMVDYLIENKLKNIVGISGFSHLPRGLANIYAYAQSKSYSINLEGVGTGRDDVPKSSEGTSPYTYYNVFRAYGLIRKEHYNGYTYENKK